MTDEIKDQSGQPTHTQQRSCTFLVGRQAVGKSSLTHAIIRSYKKRGGAVMVFAPHPAQFGKDAILIDVDNAESLIVGLMDSGFQGLVVFDDVDTWMGPSSARTVTRFCATFRHYGCDILLSSRAPQTVNINLRRCFTRICVFKMHEPRAVAATRELLGEFPATAISPKVMPPHEPFVFVDYNLETYTATKKKTVPIKVTDE